MQEGHAVNHMDYPLKITGAACGAGGPFARRSPTTSPLPQP